MSEIQKAQDMLTGAQRSVPPEIHAEQVRLQFQSPTVPETPLRHFPGGEPLPCEMGALPPRTCHTETRASARELLLHSLPGQSEWSALDSEKSVMGSLLALNAHLEFYEQRRRAG